MENHTFPRKERFLIVSHLYHNGFYLLRAEVRWKNQFSWWFFFLFCSAVTRGHEGTAHPETVALLGKWSMDFFTSDNFIPCLWNRLMKPSMLECEGQGRDNTAQVIPQREKLKSLRQSGKWMSNKEILVEQWLWAKHTVIIILSMGRGTMCWEYKAETRTGNHMEKGPELLSWPTIVNLIRYLTES